MSDKTLTRADLVEAVVESVGLPRHEAAELVETVLQELSSTLASGESVKLSSFGSFGIREKRQRIGRNPKTGKEVPITPRRVLVFRASNIMKKRIDETIKADLGKAGSAKTNSRSKTKNTTAKKASTATTRKATSKSAGKAPARKAPVRAKSKKAPAKKAPVKRTSVKRTGRSSKVTGK